MPGWRTWIAAGSVLATVLSFLFMHETTHEWQDSPPAGSSIVQIDGGLTRSFFRIHGLSLGLRFDDGFRLSWIGDPSNVPVGVVETAQGVHLVLVAWARPYGLADAPRASTVCWVRDGRPGAPTVVTPLFIPGPLVSGVRPSVGRFTAVEPALVRDTPRMPADEVLRRHDETTTRGACPNLLLPEQL